MRWLTLLAAVVAAPVHGADPAGKPNRLAKEVSPYLLQHAHNPVDWHPWGPEAFALAKKENKLVFLSIGYSACHWCHVMERESFADPKIAALMNQHFVCIKVDREERPDVDEVYMAALQALGVGGGWPLSMFLTPDAKPIFGGTYWPPADKKLPGGETATGFTTVIGRVVELTTKDRAGLYKQADKVAELTAAELDRAAPKPDAAPLDAAVVAAAADAFEFDPDHGGFGMKMNLYRGTKFPRAPALLFLLNQSAKPGQEALAKSLRLTLDKLAAGGIHDQLGGGFHRYSTERTWTVPHFEKMLYDQAQLLEVYAESYRRTKSPVDAAAAAGIARFVARELTDPAGGFYSALDADSDGEEGTYYVWTDKQITDAIGTGPAVDAFRTTLGLTGPPTFDGVAYIPKHASAADLVIPDTADMETARPKIVMAAYRAKLAAARDKRNKPFRDTKILAGWTGQMIAGYAAAGKAFHEPNYTQSAVRAAEFVLAKMRSPDGTLKRVYAARPGEPAEARGRAFLDDYAYLTHGLLNLHDATGDKRWLTAAREVADVSLAKFADPARGGFYLTPSDGEKLFTRGKDHYDGAQPSASGVTARNLARLAAATGEAKYRTAADATIRAFGEVLRTQPTSCPVTADALDRLLAGPPQ